MKKVSLRTTIVSVLATALVCTMGTGTYAKYVYQKNSNNNLIRAADFKVAVKDENQLKDKRFSINNFNPYNEAKEFPITIKKNETKVNLQYILKLEIDNKDKAIFQGQTPVKIQLMRKYGDVYRVVEEDFLHNAYKLTDLNYDENLKPKDVEEFIVKCSWNSISDKNDNKYAGLSGSFSIKFIAEQINNQTNKY